LSQLGTSATIEELGNKCHLTSKFRNDQRLQLISKSKIWEVQGHFSLQSIYEAHPQRLSQLQQVHYITHLRIILWLPIPSHISKARIFSFLLIFEAPYYTQVSSNKVARKSNDKLSFETPHTINNTFGQRSYESNEWNRASQTDQVPFTIQSPLVATSRCFFLEMMHELRATLNEGPKSRVQWNRAVLLDGRYKLDPWPLDEGPRPKSGKSRLNLHGASLEGKSLEGKSIGLNQKNRAHDFEEPRCKVGILQLV
jgi:hypothetical protein